MAEAVVAWSPVIMRTRIPASRHSAMASVLPCGADRRSRESEQLEVRHEGWRSDRWSNVAGSKSFRASARTRMPSLASRSFSVDTRLVSPRSEADSPFSSRYVDERARSTSVLP